MGKKKVIALAATLILLIAGYYVYSTGLLLRWLLSTPIGTWLFYYTPVGIIVRMLYPTPGPPKLTPEAWWEWTYRTPVPANQTAQESLAEKLIVDSVSLIRVADQPKIYTGRPEINPHITDENQTISIYDGREAIIEFEDAGRAAGPGFPSTEEAKERLNVTRSLRFRFTYKTTVLNHSLFVRLAIPINPQSGSGVGMFVTIAEKSVVSEATMGVHLGRNLFINYLPTEWFSLDVRYVDIWPGFENITGWRIREGGSFYAVLPEGGKEELMPREPYAFAVALDSAIYEPAALIKISVKNGLNQPIIAIVVRVGSESINIPLNAPLKPGERASAELGLMQPLKAGEKYEVFVKAYCLDPDERSVKFFEKPITVICEGH